MSNQNHHPDVPQPEAMSKAISSHWRQRKWKRKRRLVGSISPFLQLHRFTSGLGFIVVTLTCLSDWTQALDIDPTSSSNISLASTPASDVESLLKEVPTDLSQASKQASSGDELKPEEVYAYDYSELGSGVPAYYEYPDGVPYQYYQDGETDPSLSSQDSRQSESPPVNQLDPNIESSQSQMLEKAPLESQPSEAPIQPESQEEIQNTPAQYAMSTQVGEADASPDMEKANEKMEKILSEPVDPNDPVLHEVFPQFAAEYKADMEEEARGLEEFSFVNQSDFTLMNEKGDVETYGNIDDLDEVLDELSRGQNRMDNGEKNQQSTHEQLLSALSETGGTTTLMLFNIFTPDEVDFLSELVGEDVVNELKDEVQSDLKEANHENPQDPQDAENTETLQVRESLQAYNHPHATSSRRPFLPNPSVPKNARPSSRDSTDLLGSSSAEPSRFSTTTNAQGLVEEGLQIVTRKPEMTYSYTIDSLNRGTSEASSSTTAFSPPHAFVTKPPNQKVEERKKKFKNLLEKLSSKYSHRLKKPNEPSSEEKKAEEEDDDVTTDKMKAMIENLKKSLENTRPGVNRLTLDDVYKVQPHTFSTPSYERTTTSKPVPLKSVKSMIGDKIKSLGGGIHRLELDDVIDLDVVNIQKAKSKDSDSDSSDSQQEMTSVPSPLEPQGPPNSKHLPKRQIVHPKLMYQRANPDIIHRPSINLKSAITPSPDIATAESVKLNQRPLIARYTDAYSFAPRRPGSNYRKGSYMSIQATGSTLDPYPETKELPPYHYPTSGHLIPATVSPVSRYHSTTLRPVSRPTPPPNPSPSTTGSPYYFASTTYPLEYQESSDQATTPKYVLSSSIREGKHHDGYEQSSPTHFPPPSSQYKQPSLQFHGKKTKSEEISVTPKNIPHYSTPSYEDETHSSPTPQPQKYSTTKSPHDFPETVKSYLPPSKEYLPPTSDQKDHHQYEMKHYQAPHTDYLPPYDHKESMKHYQTPDREYLPPDHSRDMGKYVPPSKEYLPPKGSHHSKKTGYKSDTNMQHESAPSKEYVPPRDYMTKYSVPHKNYLPPHKDMTHMKPPRSDYLEPELGVGIELDYNESDMSQMKPPNKGYLPPHRDMTHMKPPVGQYHIPSDQMKHYNPPNKNYLPPHKDMEHYTPPNKGYLPPHEDMKHYKPPNQGYLPPHEDMEHYKPPNKGYLPPHEDMEHYKPPNKGYLPPHEDMEHYKPPNKGYLPPHEDMEHYKPPNKGYLPPHKDMEHYQPPNQGYLPPHKDMENYKPPNKGYLPPHEDMEHYKPPNKGYLPPHEDMKHYKPPNKGYLPPHEDMEHYKPPNKGYLPPHEDMEHYKPPNKGYLPPHEDMEHYKPPNKGYLPPHEDMEHYKPPNKGYLPPHEDMEHYNPPNKGYLPPHEDMEHYKPPNKGYLPPHKDMEHYNPPNKGYLPPHEDMEHYKPPTKGYLPPYEDMEHYKPPNKGYLPPHEDMEHYKPPNKGYLPPHEDMEHYKPPNKGYLPPHEDMEHYKPPNKGYLPPHEDMEHYQPPHQGYLPPNEGMDHYKPPDKGYLPPHKDMEHYKPPNKGYLPPHEDKDEMTEYQPPSKGYLPPHSDMHHMQPPTGDFFVDKDQMSQFRPPSKGYLPPKDGMKHLQTPSKDYLPPKSTTSYVTPHPDLSHVHTPAYSDDGHDMKHMHPPDQSYKQPHDGMDHLHPPSHGYLPPTKRPALSPAHYESCPKLAPKSGEMCKGHQKDTCAEHGTRDKHCPYEGLCCFDGCAHVCLPPDYGSANASTTTKAAIPSTLAPYQNKSSLRNFCPQVKKRESCEHAIHQCWSPGVPDVDCPGSGLCCHDGCTNVCINGYHQIESSFHLHHHHHVSYHVPPNSKYLVPGSQYIPYEVLHGPNPKGLGVSELLDQYLNHRQNPHHQKASTHKHPYEHESQPHQGSVAQHPAIPPTHGMEEIYSLKELENMELEDYHPAHSSNAQHHDEHKPVILSPPNHYRPPALGYLPPDQRGHAHFSRDHMNLDQHFELPSKSYLPPKVHPDLGEESHMMHFSPPTHGYLPPPKEKTPKSLHASRHYLPPSQGYESPSPRPKGYSTRIEFQDFQPPSKAYLPPPAGRYSSKLEVKEPTHDIKRQGDNHINKSEDPKAKPSRLYLPPEKGNSNDKSAMNHYKPPSKDYLPPLEEDFEGDDDLLNHYTPPKSEYLPPGKPAHPSKANGGKSEKIHESHGPDEHLSPPKHGYLPPKAEKMGEQHLKPPSSDYLPPKSKDSQIGTHYKPPTHGYIPPKDVNEKKTHHIESHYEVPNSDYLPPKVEAHKEQSHNNLKPPHKEYLPPKEGKKDLNSHYEPPSHGYLPPKNQGFKKINDQYEVPNYEYLPPDNNKVDNKYQHLKPPSGEYLPPKREDTKSINDHYEVPSHDYLPPHKSQDDDEHQHLKPPSGEYLPPKGNQPDIGTHYQPPSKGYLPPESHHENDAHQHLEPPSGEYLPPKGKTSAIDTHYQPPSHGYLPPKEGQHDEGHRHLKPPSGEYLPPRENKPEIGTHYQPPSHGYLPPDNGHEDDAHLHLKPPSGEYLPPQGKAAEIGTHYQPPSHGYLPPKNGQKDDNHQHLKPPSGEYLPPKGKGAELETHYQPPSHGYLPPENEAPNLDNHYQAPTRDYLPPKKENEKRHEQSDHQHLKPPSGEYLPPKGADPEIGIHYEPPSHGYLPPPNKDYSSQDVDKRPKYDQHLKPPSSGYLPPKKEASKLDNLLSPPSHGYLPPTHHESDHQDHSLDEVHLKPPSSDYLPPKGTEHHGKDQTNYSNLKPPSHDYLPPKEVTQVTVTPHSISVSEQYQPSSPGTTPYHVPPSYPTSAPEAQSISLEPNILINGKSYKLDVPGSTAVTVSPNNHLQNALPPHSINIQINIPNKDEFTIGKGIQGLGGSHYNSPEMEEKKYGPKVPEYIPGSPAVEYTGPEDENKHHEAKPSYYPDHESYNDGYGYGFNLPKPQYHKTKDHPPRKYISTKDHLRNYNPQYLPTVPKNVPYPPYLPPSPFPLGHEDGSYLFGYENKDDLYHAPGAQYLPPIDSSIVHPHLLPHPGNGHGHDGPPKLPSYQSHHGESSPDHILSPPKESYLPPDDYVPPPTPDDYIPPPSEIPSKSNGYIPPPPEPPSLTDDYLPPRVEGAKPDYIPPPPRDVLPDLDEVDAEDIPEPPSPEEVSAQQVVNSQTLPPSSSSDHYIPPKTMHDIPKNFMRPEDVPEEIPEPPAPTEIDAETISEPPEPFLGLAKLTNGTGIEESDEPKLPPMPTLAPPQPDKFLPLLRELSPELLKKLGISVNRPNPNAAQANFIPGVPGKDYPDFKSIPPTAFSCENFILEGFYADTFTSCQAFHVCESGKRQSSFLCPRGTIFNQKHRVCDWWYNVQCEDSAEFYDLNLDLILLENKKNKASLSIPPPIDPFSVAGVDSNLLSGLESDSSLLGGFGAQLLNSIGMMNVMNGIDRSDTGPSLDSSKLRIRNRPTKTPPINSLKSPSEDLFKGKQGSFVNKLSDLNQNDIDDMTSDELSKLASSLATLEQLSKDLEHFDDNEMKELLSRKSSPPSRLPTNKFLPRSGRIGPTRSASRRSDDDSDASVLSESRKASVAASLCEFMNICDNVESSPESARKYPADELSKKNTDSKIVNPVPDPVETTVNPLLRTGEKTASEIAALVAKTKAYLKEKSLDLDVAGSEIVEHSVDNKNTLETHSDFRLRDDNIDRDTTTWNPTTSHAFTESQSDVSSSSEWTPIGSLN